MCHGSETPMKSISFDIQLEWLCLIAYLKRHKMNIISQSLYVNQKTLLYGIKIIAFAVLFTFAGCDKNDDENLINETGLCLVEVDSDFIEVELDESPIYINGGHDGFVKAILEVITYPAEARENEIQGLCIVQYEIAVHGTVENIIAIQDPGGGIGGSAVAAIESATAGVSFHPGVLNGNPVRVRKAIEILYKLQ